LPPSNDLKQDILDLLRENAADGLRKSDIRRRLKLLTRAEQAAFRAVFSELTRDGAVTRQHRGRYRLRSDARHVSGRLSLHRRGYGFVRPDDQEMQDVFIPPHATGEGLPGDRVLVSLTDPHASRGPVGRVERVLARVREEITGQLVATRMGLFLHPLRNGYPDLIEIENARELERTGSLGPGAWVVAALRRRPNPKHPILAKVLRRATEATGIDGTLDAVATEFELPAPYSAEVCRFAAQSSLRDLPRQFVAHPAAITIDPADAKDFDDALSAAPGPNPGTVEVGVHIADVAAYVPAGGELDTGARQRGFTAYLPGRTLPMLPEPLAADLCSLVEGVARPAHSVFLLLDADSGEVLQARRCRTWVRVCRRLSFRETQDYLAGRAGAAQEPPEVRRTLKLLAATFNAMRVRRAATEQFLTLARSEVRVLCSEKPARILGLLHTAPSEAHALVEEFMLAANTAVARELAARRIPGLYRCHSNPKPRDLTALRAWIRDTLHIRTGHLGDRAALNRLIADLDGVRGGELGLQALLRALPRAVYSAESRPHFGLGKSQYCHFTSPIRRYPDLVVHQQLLAADLGEPVPRSLAECGEIAAECTEKERQIDEAFFAAQDRLKLHYLYTLLENNEHPVFEAVAMRVERGEVTVYVPELGMYGSVGGRSYVASRGAAGLHGRRTELRFRPGDVLFVEPRAVDIGRGIFELQPVQPRLPGAMNG